jgi:acyl dehydratase
MVLRPGENLKPMIYDELVVGEELPTLEMVIDEDLQGRYLVAVQDDNPWYYRDSPWGGPITHHCLLDGSPMAAAMQRYEYPFGWVHAKQETEFINPLPLGKPVRIVSKIVDKYIRRGRGYVVIESLVVDQDGVEIMRSRNYGMIDDERVREAARSGLKHFPPPPSQQFRKRS